MKCIYPFSLILLNSNDSKVDFDCEFKSVLHTDEKWTENIEIQPPFLLLDKGFTVQVNNLMDLYNMNYDCISLWNPFGFESLGNKFDHWNQVAIFPWAGAILIKESNYDTCIYPQVNRVIYDSNWLSINELQFFQDIGKKVTVRLPTDSTQYTVTSKMGNNIIINSEIPTDIVKLETLPVAEIQKLTKTIIATNYTNIGLICPDCSNSFMVKQYLHLLNIPVMSFKQSIPSKIDFFENFFVLGYIQIPFGIYTLYLLSSPDPTSVLYHLPLLDVLTYKFDLILPKTSCAEYCNAKEKECDIKAMILMNNCDAMINIFSCKYCYSSRRLIYYFKTGICEVARLDKLSCYTSGFGSSPCICH